MVVVNVLVQYLFYVLLGVVLVHLVSCARLGLGQVEDGRLRLGMLRWVFVEAMK